MSIFVSCSPQLETLLAEELDELGIRGVTLAYCGVNVRFNSDEDAMRAVYTINYNSRIATRVLLPLQRFRCYDQSSLYKAASRINWRPFFRRGQTLAIDANVRHPKLRNSLFAAQVVKDAICDQLREITGSRPSVDTKNPDVQLNLYIHDQEAILSFDTSGDPLHKRGYRQDAGEAPLQESLAAALLRLAKYDENQILIDPCCGSGTFLIEACLIASRTPPGYLRKKWGFANHPGFINEEWLVVKNRADAHRKTIETKQFFGCELDATVARYCRDNLRAAGFLDVAEVVRQDFVDYEPKVAPNFLITNPPHGRRLGDINTLKSLYRSLGDFMKRKLAKPGRGFVFVGDLELAKEVGLQAKRRHVVSNSGVDSRLLEYDLY